MSLVKNEPVGTAAGILGIVTAAFPLLAAFKVNIDQAQQSAITGFLIVLLGFWVRSRVSPVGRAAKLKEDDDKDDDDPPAPPISRPPLIPAACLAFVLLACSSDKPAIRPPTEADLAKACPAAFEASTVGCAEIAVKHCRGFETLDECPRGEQARAECKALREEKLASCH